mgnify:CR=1 FL=1
MSSSVATVLVENHSLKPYDQRVLGTRVLLEAALRTLGEQFSALRQAREADRAARPASIPLSWGPGTREKLLFKGLTHEARPSPVSGGTLVVWSGRPLEQEVELLHMDATATAVAPPAAYWAPPSYPEAIERLRLHGIRMERINGPRTPEVEALRLSEPVIAVEPVEGPLTAKGTATAFAT